MLPVSRHLIFLVRPGTGASGSELSSTAQPGLCHRGTADSNLSHDLDLYPSSMALNSSHFHLYQQSLNTDL